MNSRVCRPAAVLQYPGRTTQPASCLSSRSRTVSLRSACRLFLQISTLPRASTPLRGRKWVTVRAEAVSAASVTSMDQPPDAAAADESVPAWDLRTRWHNWWDLKGTIDQNKMPPAEKLTATLRRMWMLVKGERKLIAGSAVFMTLAAFAELLIPHYVSASIFAVANKLPEAHFHSTVKLLAAFSFSYGIFAGLRGFLFSLLATRLMEQLRSQVFNALIRQPVAFFDEEEVGALTSRLGADCQAIVRCLATNLNVAVRNALQCIGGATYLLLMSRQLAASCACVTSVLWLVALRYGAFQRKSQRLYQDALADTTQVSEEVFTLSRTVRTFGTERREGERYLRWLKRLTHLSVRQAVAYLMYLTTNSGFYYLTKVATLLVGGTMAYQGHISAQQLTAFVMYVEFVTSASLSVCDQWGPAMEALGASERVISYLDAPEAPQIASGTPLPNFSGHVEFKDVTFRYPTRQDVLSLNGVNLTLRPGKLVALVGLSGSGKSTVVALLQRLYDSTGGKILVDGKDVTTVDAGDYRRQLGVVSQDPHLLSMTIADNIAYGLEGADRPSQDEIEAAAEAANAHGFIRAFPRDYNTSVTDKLLSGGQRQRIALARALVRKPRLLILDEATSALDAASEAQVQAALDRAMKATNRSCLVIAHRLVTVRNADEILVMDKGQIVEKGSHEALVAAGGIYAGLVARQSGGGLGSSTAEPAASMDKGDAAHVADSIAASQDGDPALAGADSNVVPLTPKRERETSSNNHRAGASLETFSLDEEPPTEEMWAASGEVTHDVPDHAPTKAT